MPYKSLAQAGYFHANKARLEAQGVDVDEWDAATRGKKLPKRVKKADGGKLSKKDRGRLGALFSKEEKSPTIRLRPWELEYEAPRSNPYRLYQGMTTQEGFPMFYDRSPHVFPKTAPAEILGVYAAGGIAPYLRSGQFERTAQRGVTQGMLNSRVPGRTDKLPIDVSPGSYVMPADIVSSLGQGNSAAGGAILTKMFSGAKMNKYGGGKFRMPGVKGMKRGQFAEGGEAENVPIIAAGGEYVLSPEEVEFVGGGDMDKGHQILDRFVLKQRASHIKTLKKLPPPKAD